MLSVYLNICAGLALALLSALFWLGVFPAIVDALAARGIGGYTYWKYDWPGRAEVAETLPVHVRRDGEDQYMCGGWHGATFNQTTKHEYRTQPCSRCHDQEAK